MLQGGNRTVVVPGHKVIEHIGIERVIGLPPSLSPVPGGAVERGEIVDLGVKFIDWGAWKWKLSVNWGDASPEETLDLSASPAGNGAFPIESHLQHVYLANGEYIVQSCVRDVADDQVSCYSAVTTVGPADGSAGTISLGLATELVGIAGSATLLWPVSFAGPAGASRYTTLINWGDGGPADVVTVSGPFFRNHTYQVAGDFEITVIIVDDDRSIGMARAVVHISAAIPGNNTPVVNAGPDRVVVLGGNVTVGPVTLFDIDLADTHVARINWADGTPVQELVNAPTVFDIAHTYTEIGVYLVTVIVIDSRGASAIDTVTVTVKLAVIVSGALATPPGQTFNPTPDGAHPAASPAGTLALSGSFTNNAAQTYSVIYFVVTQLSGPGCPCRRIERGRRPRRRRLARNSPRGGTWRRRSVDTR